MSVTRFIDACCCLLGVVSSDDESVQIFLMFCIMCWLSFCSAIDHIYLLGHWRNENLIHTHPNRIPGNHFRHLNWHQRHAFASNCHCLWLPNEFRRRLFPLQLTIPLTPSSESASWKKMKMNFMLLLERFQSHLHVVLMRFDVIDRLKHVWLVTIPFNTFKYNILHPLVSFQSCTRGKSALMPADLNF